VVGGQTQHARDAGPEDIGVDEPHPAADVSERERQIHGDGRLAHAALPAAHRDDVADARQPVLRTADAPGVSGRVRLLGSAQLPCWR
jgi:hypothetical protein